MPDDLASKPYLRPLYGCVPFVVRDVMRRYAGWWSGEPSQMFPAKRSEVATEILALCGRDQMLASARDLKDAAELKPALALAEMALDANSGGCRCDLGQRRNPRCAGGLERSFIARNFFAGAARQLRERAKQADLTRQGQK